MTLRDGWQTEAAWRNGVRTTDPAVTRTFGRNAPRAASDELYRTAGHDPATITNWGWTAREQPSVAPPALPRTPSVVPWATDNDDEPATPIRAGRGRAACAPTTAAAGSLDHIGGVTASAAAPEHFDVRDGAPGFAL